jgi:hypothetical protein
MKRMNRRLRVASMGRTELKHWLGVFVVVIAPLCGAADIGLGVMDIGNGHLAAGLSKIAVGGCYMICAHSLAVRLGLAVPLGRRTRAFGKAACGLGFLGLVACGFASGTSEKFSAVSIILNAVSIGLNAASIGIGIGIVAVLATAYHLRWRA